MTTQKPTFIYQHSVRFNVNRFWTGGFWTAKAEWAKIYPVGSTEVFEVAEKLNNKASVEEPVYVRNV